MFNFGFDLDFNKLNLVEYQMTATELKKVVKNICEFKKNEFDNINWKQVGQYILSDYSIFVNVVFNIVENRRLEKHLIQKKLENTFSKLEKQDITRLVLNMPPRGGKSFNARYFCLYTMLKYRCNYIYTSYNADLLVEFSNEFRKIVSNSVMQEMFEFGNKKNFEISSYEYDFYDSYFREKMEEKAKISNKKITIKGNNLYLMCSGTTTGFGAGYENCKTFCGGLICDDMDKITNIYIDGRDNEKVKTWFSAILLSRLQGSAFLMNLQQRLGTNDSSGYILEHYTNFENIKLPLVDENGVCNIPYYSKERIEELMLDKGVWLAQYQQTPKDDLENMPYADCPVVEYSGAKGNWIAWLDPAGSGKDSTSICLIRRVGVMLEVLGWQWRKDWKFCINDLMEIDKLFDIKKLIVEVNMTGDIIVDNLIQLGINCSGYRTKENKTAKILAMQCYSQNINLAKHSYESNANESFINNVKRWNKLSKHDDGIDSLASYMLFAGLTHL